MSRGWVWALAGLLLGLLAFAPLRLALDWSEASRALASRAVAGSIWSGRLVDARLGGAALGDVAVRLAPLSLLRGTAVLRLRGAPGSGIVVLHRTGGGVRQLTVRLDPLLRVAGVPVAQAQSADLTALFARGRCVRAGGRLAVTLGPPVPSSAALNGEARCDGDAVLVPLSATSGEVLSFRVRADRAFSVDLRMPTADPAALLALGFAPAPGGVALRLEGRL